MHQDFCICIASQVEIALRQNLFFQLRVIGQLPVEAERKPFVLFDVMPFKRLSVSAIVGTARGVTDMPDCRDTGVFVHQCRCFLLMVQVEDFGHRADILVRIDQLSMFRMINRHPGSKLPPILDFQQQPRNMPRNLRGIFLGC